MDTQTSAALASPDAAAPESEPVAVTCWTARLVDPQCERDYRWQRFRDDRRRAVQLVLFVAVVSLLNVLGDLYGTWQDGPTVASLARPLAVTVLPLSALLLVRRMRTPYTLEMAMALSALVGGTMRMTMLTFHAEMIALWPAWIVATLFIYYIYLPVRLTVSLTMALVFSLVAPVWWWYLQQPVMPFDHIARGILWLMLVNGLAFLAANSLQRSQRTQYAQSLVLQQLLSTDALTGIANRRRFDVALAREWRRAARARMPLSLLMIDVDHFKAFNDYCGHQQGDECLRQVARVLVNAVGRPGDLVARYGGEEFICLLPAIDDAGARAVADRLLRAVRAAAIAHPRSPSGPRLTISIGVATTADFAGGPDALMALADRLLYAAKDAGRDRFMSGALGRGQVRGLPPVPAEKIALAG